jgi:hypothetical protein
MGTPRAFPGRLVFSELEHAAAAGVAWLNSCHTAEFQKAAN